MISYQMAGSRVRGVYRCEERLSGGGVSAADGPQLLLPRLWRSSRRSLADRRRPEFARAEVRSGRSSLRIRCVERPSGGRVVLALSTPSGFHVVVFIVISSSDRTRNVAKPSLTTLGRRLRNDPSRPSVKKDRGRGPATRSVTLARSISSSQVSVSVWYI